MILAPTNPVACHVGNGMLVLYWDIPTTGTVKRYEIYLSLSESGIYKRYFNGSFTENRGQIYNVPMNETVYLRVKAIDVDGSESSLAQFTRGKIEKPIVSMKCRAIHGSLIPKDAVFSVHDSVDRIVAAKAVADINIVCP